MLRGMKDRIVIGEQDKELKRDIIKVILAREFHTTPQEIESWPVEEVEKYWLISQRLREIENG